MRVKSVTVSHRHVLVQKLFYVAVTRYSTDSERQHLGLFQFDLPSAILKKCAEKFDSALLN